jgi:hypothetical protein
MGKSDEPRGEGEERPGERGAEFVQQIVTDPRNVPDVMRLYGYSGASSEEHHERLYLNPDLSQYVEVPANAVLHRMVVPAEQDLYGAVVLWVRRDAALIYKSAPAAQALASYFAGAIAGAAAAGAGPGPQPWAVQHVAGAIGGNTLYPHLCTPQCNTQYPYCGTVTPACTNPVSVCGCRYPGAAAPVQDAAVMAAAPQGAALEYANFFGHLSQLFCKQLTTKCVPTWPPTPCVVCPVS